MFLQIYYKYNYHRFIKHTKTFGISDNNINSLLNDIVTIMFLYF